MAKDAKLSIKEHSRLMYIVYQNIHKLIKYRGYSPDTQLYEDETALLAALKKTDPLVITGRNNKNATGSLKIFLVQNKDIMSKQKLPAIIDANSSSKDDVIIIFDKKMKSAYNVAITEAEKRRDAGSSRIWYMTFDRLLMVIPEHVLVGGTFRILSNDEVVAIEKLNRIISSDLIKMPEYDPIALWYGAVAGNVVEGTMASETGGLATKYYYIIPQPRYG